MPAYRVTSEKLGIDEIRHADSPLSARQRVADVHRVEARLLAVAYITERPSSQAGASLRPLALLALAVVVIWLAFSAWQSLVIEGRLWGPPLATGSADDECWRRKLASEAWNAGREADDPVWPTVTCN